MYVKVEPTGCCERKGLVQVRLCMYLDKNDYGFEKHLVKGKNKETGEDFEQVNPFHNHFIYIEPETTDDEIMDIAEAYLHEAYIKWACDSRIILFNYHTFSEIQKGQECIFRINKLRQTELKRVINDCND